MPTLIRALLFFILTFNLAHGQTASILPPGKTTFFDSNGNPLTSGTVTFYYPGTSTLKTTWQDAAEATPNANPVVLDAAGRALIYGDGNYRQLVKDRNGNTIWDALTSATGAGGGGGSATGDGDLVGTIKPWSGLIAPNQYAFSYGQEISRSTYSVLFTAITSSQNANCNSASPILTGLADTAQIPVGAAVEIICLAPGATVLSKTISTITVSSNATISTSAAVIIFPYGNGDGSTTFNLPDLRGRAVAGRDNMGGTAASRLTSTYFGETASATGANGGSESKTLITGNLPAYTPAGTVGITDPGHSHGLEVTITNFANGGNTIARPLDGDPALPNIIASATTGITATFTGTAQGGTSTPFATIQPTLTLNYIIKITPDTSTAIATGVSSLGGMTGVIACGSGVLCTGNNISFDGSTASISSANVTFLGAYSGAVLRTELSKDRDIISVRDFGAVDTGISSGANDTALTNAVAACATNKIIFPSVTGDGYGHSVTLDIPDGCVMEFHGVGSRLKYFGINAAAKIENNKNLSFYNFNVDLTSAGSSAVGLQIKGLWFGDFYSARCRVNGANQACFTIETSAVGGNEWGAYLINFYNIDCQGTGLYCISTFQTVGDTVETTHLNVFGGWSNGPNYGLHYRNVSTYRIEGFAQNGTTADGLNIAQTNNGYVSPGELGPNGGYGINWGASNSAITLIIPSAAGIGGTLGYQNNTTYTPQQLKQGIAQFFASTSDQTYYWKLSSIFNYGKSFSFSVNGGGSEQEILYYGDTNGTSLNTPTTMQFYRQGVLSAQIDANKNLVSGFNIAAGSGGYYNFGATLGSSGYGFRDNLGSIEVKGSGGSWVQVGTVTGVNGTTNRIDVGGTASTPQIDIAPTYVGQTSLTTLGTIGTGTWNATPVTGQYGGTGVNNSGKTITLGGDFVTSGAFATTLTVTGITNVTLPTTGILAITANANVASVSNSNSTLTISPTTGAVVASLNLSNANTWVGQQTFVSPILGVATGTSLALGGCTISTHAFCATGTSLISSTSSATGFIATSTAGVALSMSGSSAIRDTTNGASTMYFDVSLGGATNGNWIWRSSNSLNQAMNLSGLGAAVFGSSISVGASSLTLTTGAIGLSKMTASASAPGAGGGKLELVCGTAGGSAKLVIYAGTSGTAVTIADNIGTGVTGC